MARTSNRNATVMESPRQGDESYLTRCLASAREPLVMTRNNTATPQVTIASVKSQLLTISHAGRTNRKKFSGFPNIGSITLPVAWGADQNSASVGHSVIISK